jgi:hypothetical protein
MMQTLVPTLSGHAAQRKYAALKRQAVPVLGANRIPDGLILLIDTSKRPGAARALKEPRPGTIVGVFAGVAPPHDLYLGLRIAPPRRSPAVLLLDFLDYGADLGYLTERRSLTLLSGPIERTPLSHLGLFTADVRPAAITIEIDAPMRRALSMALEQCAQVALEAVQR